MNATYYRNILWGAAPGIGYTIVIATLIGVAKPPSMIASVLYTVAVFAAVDILRHIGLKTFKRYLKLTAFISLAYTLFYISFVRWGATGILLFVVCLALYKILRNKEGYKQAIRSFDYYLEKWDPKYRGKQK